MTRYIVSRVLYAILVVFGTVSVVFVIIHVITGNPALLFAGPDSTPQQITAVRRQLHLNEPLYMQYLHYIGGLVHGDFGRSYRLNEGAMSAALGMAPSTAVLAFSAIGLAICISFPLGQVAARRPRSGLDRTVSSLSLVGQALPNFWIGILAIMLFSGYLGWLPSFGSGGLTYLVMPAVTLALPYLGLLVRLVRSGLIETYSEAYVLTATAKGLTRRQIVYGHAVKNMAIPVLTVSALQLGQVLAGAVVIETVFGRPGLGSLLLDAMTNRDYAVVQAVVILISTVFVTINLITDILYAWLDPRVRLGAGR